MAGLLPRHTKKCIQGISAEDSAVLRVSSYSLSC